MKTILLTHNVRNADSIDAAVVNSLHKGDVGEGWQNGTEGFWLPLGIIPQDR